MKKILIILSLSLLSACSSNKTQEIPVSDVEIPSILGSEIKEEFAVSEEKKKAMNKVEIKKDPKEKGHKLSENTSKAVEPAFKLAADATPIYKVGQKSHYAVFALGFKAGYIDTEVLPYKYIKNKITYHFKATVSTTSIFKSIYYVNDLVESYVDVEKFYSLRYQMKAEEGKAKKQRLELYDSEKQVGIFWKKIEEKGTVKETKKEIAITPFSQDILSSLFYLKTIDYSKKEHSLHILTSEKDKTVKLVVEGKETISYKNKKYEVYRVNLKVKDAKLEDNIIYYYSKDLNEITKIYVPLKVGSVSIELQ